MGFGRGGVCDVIGKVEAFREDITVRRKYKKKIW